MKMQTLNYVIDTNAMNSQNISIQCLVNQMILMHMVLDITLFYINYQQKRELYSYV